MFEFLLLIVFFIFLIYFGSTLEPLRFTRGMSYDLRGDPCIIRPNWMPWNMSSWAHLPALYNPHLPYCDELPF